MYKTKQKSQNRKEEIITELYKWICHKRKNIMLLQTVSLWLINKSYKKDYSVVAFLVHIPETGAVNRLHFLAPVFGAGFCTICTWKENSWRRNK